MPSPLPDDVRAALAAGEKIEAIQLLRRRTGLGLADAKAAVESGLVPPAPEGAPQTDGFPPEVSAALAAGDKITAIRLLREGKGVDLKEAKAMVEAAQQDSARQQPRGPSGLAPGEVPRGGFGAGFVVLIVVLVAVVAWLLIGPR